MVLISLVSVLNLSYFYISTFRSLLLLLLLLLLCNPQSLNHCRLGGSQNRTGLTDWALIIHFSAKNSVTVWHVLIITAFCVRMFRCSRNLFGMIAVVDSKIVIRYYAGRFHLQNS